jgi:hypothetical protein
LAVAHLVAFGMEAAVVTATTASWRLAFGALWRAVGSADWMQGLGLVPSGCCDVLVAALLLCRQDAVMSLWHHCCYAVCVWGGFE